MTRSHPKPTTKQDLDDMIVLYTVFDCFMDGNFVLVFPNTWFIKIATGGSQNMGLDELTSVKNKH